MLTRRSREGDERVPLLRKWDSLDDGVATESPILGEPVRRSHFLKHRTSAPVPNVPETPPFPETPKNSGRFSSRSDLSDTQ